MEGRSMEQAQARQRQQEEAEMQREMILQQILTPEAKDRLSRIALVKGEKARQVGDSLIHAATTGKLAAKVTEEALIQMLEQMPDGDGETKVRKVTIQRRRGFDSDEEDNDDDI